MLHNSDDMWKNTEYKKAGAVLIIAMKDCDFILDYPFHSLKC